MTHSLSPLTSRVSTEGKRKEELCEDHFNAEVVMSLIPIFHWPKVSPMAPPNIKGLWKHVAVSTGRARDTHFRHQKQGLRSEEVKTSLEK